MSQKPTLGRVVFYNFQRFPDEPIEPRAAHVVHVNDNGKVNLKVLAPNTAHRDFVAMNVEEGTTAGTWSWPPRSGS